MKKFLKRHPLLHLVGPLILGLSFLAMAIGHSMWSAWFVWTGASAEGRVVRLIPRESSTQTDDDQFTTFLVFSPEFVFTAADGRQYDLTARAGSNPPGYVVGQPVHVLYQKSNPQQARIATFGQLWGMACGFGAAGLLLTGVGCVLLWWGRRRLRLGLPLTSD